MVDSWRRKKNCLMGDFMYATGKQSPGGWGTTAIANPNEDRGRASHPGRRNVDDGERRK
jgi:hypothetical protein